jgi:elongation factor G
MALAKLAEDPTFTVRTDESSGQTIISQVWVVTFDILVDRMRREFKVEVNQGEPQVEYKSFTNLRFIEDIQKLDQVVVVIRWYRISELEPADEVEGKVPKVTIR